MKFERVLPELSMDSFELFNRHVPYATWKA
jgi:hypothetical protein